MLGDTSASALVSASFQNQLVKLLKRDGLVQNTSQEPSDLLKPPPPQIASTLTQAPQVSLMTVEQVINQK
jgi:hypothetical protein